MAEQERIQKSKSVQRREDVQKEVEAKVSKTAEELKTELDELLESIDEALGENLENAFAFTQGFLQRGGQ